MIKLPKHIAFELSHNDPERVYETVADRINREISADYFADDAWVSAEQKAKAIETNSIWTAHWYPDTPVGFHVLHAADLDVLLEALARFDDG